MYPPHHLGGYELTWRSSVEQLRAAGHEVAVLTTGFRRDDPDPAFPEDPQARRELRWYWHDHEFPRLSLGERLALERHNKTALAREIDDVPARRGVLVGHGRHVAGADRAGAPGGHPRRGRGGRRLDGLRTAGGRLDDASCAACACTAPGSTSVTWLFNSAATRDAAGQARWPGGPPRGRHRPLRRPPPARLGLEAALRGPDRSAQGHRRRDRGAGAPAAGGHPHRPRRGRGRATGPSSTPCARGWASRTGSRSASGPGMSSRPRTRQPTRCCSPCAGPSPGAWSRWRR